MSDTVFTVRVDERLARSAAERLTVPLEDIGAAFALFEVDEARGVWELSVYATDDTLAAVEREIARAVPDIALEKRTLPETDWVAHSLKGLKPVLAGGFMVHGSHDRDAVRTGWDAIEIDAGQAFGTGHHGTTAGCLIALDEVLKRTRPRRALDVGTGSGVLAIGLAMRTKRPVVATDIDPVAVRVARENARRNEVGPLVRAVAADGLHHPTVRRHGPYDLVVANILAGPLRALAPSIAQACAPDAHVILSGLLERQGRQVLAAYRLEGFRLERSLVLDGWATLTLCRSGAARHA